MAILTSTYATTSRVRIDSGSTTVRAGSGPRIGSLILYLAMGWFCVLAWDSLVVLLSPTVLGWMIVGGAFYTSGIVFYILDSWYPWCHGIWHLFVLAGSISHYFAILLL